LLASDLDYYAIKTFDFDYEVLWVDDMLFLLGMCYILCMCVFVGTSNTTTTSDDPFTYSPFVCTGHFLRGVPGGWGGAGQVCPPVVMRNIRGSALNFFFGRFLLFLADL
jgi:hypothetical protein